MINEHENIDSEESDYEVGHRDGEAVYRKRAEKAEARVAETESALREIALTQVRPGEDDLLEVIWRMRDRAIDTGVIRAAKRECCACGLASAREPSVVLRGDGTTRCNDCWTRNAGRANSRRRTSTPLRSSVGGPRLPHPTPP